MKNKMTVVVTTALILVSMVLIGSYFYKKNEQKKQQIVAEQNSDVFVRPHSPAQGPDNAQAVLVEFLDPECEGCRAFHPLLKKILADYPGQIRLVVRMVPLHGNSKFAIQILRALDQQGKFWPALDLLFSRQPEWADHMKPQPEKIWDILAELGADLGRVREQMQDSRILSAIDEDMRDGSMLGIRGTPSFYLNGQALDLSEEAIRAALDQELKK